MGCTLAYRNRRLDRIIDGGSTRDTKCTISVSHSQTSKSSKKGPIKINVSKGPNRWEYFYIFPDSDSKPVTKNNHYWIDSEGDHFFFVDSNGDAWFFSTRMDFEESIANYNLRGPGLHLTAAQHFSQYDVSIKVKHSRPTRFQKVLQNMEEAVFQIQPEPTVVEMAPAPEVPEDILQILDIEFTKKTPKKKSSSLELELDSIRESITKKST